MCTKIENYIGLRVGWVIGKLRGMENPNQDTPSEAESANSFDYGDPSLRDP